MSNGVMVDNYGQVIVSSLKTGYPKLYNRILHLAVEVGNGTISQESMIQLINNSSYSPLELFHADFPSEGRVFWNHVNLYELWDYAQAAHPQLFGQDTFVNCFGVEIVEKTQLRADDDVSVDFTKKKRISDY
jgi:hypothetical protein